MGTLIPLGRFKLRKLDLRCPFTWFGFGKGLLLEEEDHSRRRGQQLIAIIILFCVARTGKPRCAWLGCVGFFGIPSAAYIKGSLYYDAKGVPLRKRFLV